MERKRSHGTSLVLTAFAMFALLATAALAIDWGLVYLARHQLQNFVDAAALAGAQELPSAPQAKQAAAENYARNFGENRLIPPPTPQQVSCPPSDPDLQPTTTCYKIGDDLVHITTPYQRTGDPSPNPNLINVKACRVVSLFFARVLGVRQIRVCAKATAIGSRPAIARGLIVLDPSGGNALWLQGNARLQVLDGEIDPSICEELEKHLRDCDPCKVIVDTVRKTILLYKGTELYELPYEVKERLHSLLREKWKEKFPTAAC
jgi:hypothetical protein